MHQLPPLSPIHPLLGSAVCVVRRNKECSPILAWHLWSAGFSWKSLLPANNPATDDRHLPPPPLTPLHPSFIPTDRLLQQPASSILLTSSGFSTCVLPTYHTLPLALLSSPPLPVHPPF